VGCRLSAVSKGNRAVQASRDSRAVFEETQHLREPWVWAFVALVSVASLVWAGLALLSGDEIPPSLVVMVFVGLAAPAFIAWIRLRIIVTEHEVVAALRPLIRRRIPLDQIVSAQARTYRPLLEFGGWGIRWGRDSVRAYTIAGNRGVELLLLDGQKVLLGTRHPEELAEAIAKERM
jgi:hypothetical protein